MVLLVHVMELRRTVAAETFWFAWWSRAVCHLVNEDQSVFFIRWTLPRVTRYYPPAHAPFLLQILAPLSGVTMCNPIVRAAHTEIE